MKVRSKSLTHKLHCRILQSDLFECDFWLQFFFQNKEKNISNCFIAWFFVLIAQKTWITYQKHCFWLWNPSLFFQILSVSAIVLANLCVSYIMTSQNEEVCIIFSLHKKESNLLQQNIIKLLPHHTIILCIC